MHALVTGAAGFIGSTLCDRLLAVGHHVLGVDDLSTGSLHFLKAAAQNPSFRFVQQDLSERSRLPELFAGHELVFHLAANADVRFGLQHPAKDLQQNTIVTFNVLDAMRLAGVRRIAFASTGSVYGEPDVFPTPESAPFPVQTSLYGASKLAGEGLVSAYCEGFGFQGWIFRFVSILGERYSHGHVFDFYKRLRANPTELEVLGNGQQRKSYLYVQDCIDAMLLAVDNARDKVNIFNLGTDEYCKVTDSIAWITGHLGLTPKLAFSGGERGWIGDSPFIFLDCSKIRSLGWKPSLSIREGILRTVQYLQMNEPLLEARA
jgi:UDP-glucose 4-epimerase